MFCWRFIFLIIFLIISGSTKSQSSELRGKICDSTSKAPVPYATIAVYKKRDSTLITFQLSDKNGIFKISSIPRNISLRIVVTSISRVSFQDSILIPLTQDNFDVGNIYLSENFQLMDTVKIIAERPPVIVKSDMVEFDASAFKTRPNSLIEDLLKKLPGILINSNGELFFNGRRVNRITIDGKYFFSSDPTMVTKNLPAEIVDQIQIRGDMSEIEKNPDLDIGSVGSVINLVLKKSAKNSWFGKTYMGYGSKKRYEGGLVSNQFKEKVQIGVLAFGNNINKSRFTLKDLQSLGAVRVNSHPFIKSDIGSESNFFTSNFSLFFSDDIGINTSKGTAINFSYTPSNKFNLYGQFFFLNKRQVNNRRARNTQFLGDTIVETSTRNLINNPTRSYAFNSGGYVKMKNEFDLNLGLSLAQAESKSLDTGVTDINSNIGGRRAFGLGSLNSDISYGYITEEASLTKKFKRNKRRRLSFYESLTYRKGNSATTSEFDTEYYFPSVQDFQLYQQRRQNIPSSLLSLSCSYTEPISSTLLFRYSGKFNLSTEREDLKTFYRNQGGFYDSLDLINSSSQRYNRAYHKSSFVLLLEKAKYSLIVGVVLHEQKLKYKSLTTGGSIISTKLLTPTIRVSWNMNSIEFKTDVGAPLARYLSPIPDSSNPFIVSLPNANLKAPVTQRLVFNIYQFKTKNKVFLNANFSASIIRNDIVLARTINQTGAQSITPKNSNGTILTYAFLEIGKEKKINTKLSYNYKIGGSTNFNKRKVEVNKNIAFQNNLTLNPSINITLSLLNIFEIKNEYQYRISRSVYSDKVFRNTRNVEHINEAGLLFYIGKGVVFESSIMYSYLRTNSFQKNITLTLVNSSFIFYLKKKVGQIKIEAFDLFNKNRGVFRYNMNNFLSETNNDVLNQYFMISFLHNFKQKIKTKQEK